MSDALTEIKEQHKNEIDIKDNYIRKIEIEHSSEIERLKE